MPKMLNDGAVEYEDGIPATEAQVFVFMKLQCVVNNFSISHALYFQICFIKLWKLLCLFPNVTIDGEGCCNLFILGSRT